MSTASKPATAAAGIVLATQSPVPFSNPSSGVPYILGHSDTELRRSLAGFWERRPFQIQPRCTLLA